MHSDIGLSSSLGAYLKAGFFLRRMNADGSAKIFWGQSDYQGVGLMDFFEGKIRYASEPSKELSSGSVDEFKAFLKLQGPSNENLKAQDFEDPSLGLFEKSFQDIQGRIFRSEIEKAVPVVFSRSSKTPSLEIIQNWVLKVLETPASLWAFGVWDEKGGILGATPEVLFHRQKRELHSMALAGTMTKDRSPNDLMKSAKDRHEHNIVIQDIREKLEKFGWVKIEETKVIELPTLFHLCTPIHVDAVEAPTQEIVQAMHPTAALGVFPRNYGISWMKQLPYQEERGQFGGPILFQLPEEEIALVAIRCVQWNKRGTQFGAGCGLVKTSEFRAEWEELLAKINSTKKILGLV